MPKVVYVDGGNLFVVSKSPSSNKKITGSNADIVQAYTFSLEQYQLANREEVHDEGVLCLGLIVLP